MYPEKYHMKPKFKAILLPNIKIHLKVFLYENYIRMSSTKMLSFLIEIRSFHCSLDSIIIPMILSQGVQTPEIVSSHESQIKTDPIIFYNHEI